MMINKEQERAARRLEAAVKEGKKRRAREAWARRLFNQVRHSVQEDIRSLRKANDSVYERYKREREEMPLRGDVQEGSSSREGGDSVSLPKVQEGLGGAADQALVTKHTKGG